MKNRLLITAAIFFSSLYCIAQTPEINVYGNGIPIADGDLIPTTADHSDFGSVLVCNGTIIRTFVIHNPGTGNLNISSTVITGTNASDFNVTLLPAAFIVPGGSSIFRVTFDPSATGIRSAVITINSDDADEAAYDFGIQGIGNADIVNPSISCLPNINVNNDPGQCSAIVTYTAPVGTDNCPSATTAQIAGLPSGSAFPVGVTVNTFRVTDGSGNTATCSFSVTVTDTEAPVLYTMNCIGSNASAPAYSDGWQTGDNDGSGFSAWTLAASTGNSSQAGFLMASSITNGAGTDSNGDQDINTSGLAWGMYANSAQATQATRTLSSPLTVGSSLVAELDNGSVDPGQIIGFQLMNSSGLSLGEIRYRGGQAGYEIVDANGITPFVSIPFTDEGIIIEVIPIVTGQAAIKLTRKVNGATQTLVSMLFPGGGNQVIQAIKVFNSNAGVGISKYLFVNKLQICSSVVGCPANVNVSNNPGVCGATVVYANLLASDNCSSSLSVTQTAGLASGSLFPVGITTNSFSVTDASGNNTTCSFTVTVNDVEAPTVICNDTTLYLSTSGDLIITPAAIDLGSSDACGIASMSVFPNTFNCSQVAMGEPVTLTVTDVNGNSGTCVSLVNIYDNLSPVAICQNINVYLNASGNVAISPAMVNNGSYDNCGIVSTNVTPNTFNCSNLGANNVTLTVFDSFGQNSSCTAVVTVLDTIAPVANCYSQNVYLNNITGTISLVPGMIDNGSTDNCGITSRSISPNNFNCTNLGPNTVTLTVTDASGNSSTCTSVITVLDSMHPVANCQNINLYLNPPFATANIIPAMLNNGSYDNCGIASMSVSPNSVNCSNVGPTNVTLTVTDNSGNIFTCTSIVTVLDSLRPVANCQNITVTLNASGTASITGAMVNNGSTDLCGIASMSVSPNTFNCTNVGANNVVFTVTDINGNSSTCNAIVTVQSDLSATITVNNHVSCNGGNDGQVTVTPTGGSGSYFYSWTPSVTGSGPTVSGLSAQTYTCTIIDANGCTTTQTVSITQPTLLTSASSATSILCNGGNATVTVTGSGGTFPYSGEGTFTETAGTYSYIVTDANGCTSTTTITVTEPTVLASGSSATSILCNGGNATVTVTGSGGTSPYTGTGTFTETAGTYSYIVTDANGCTSTTTITVTEPTVLSGTSSATSILCNGGNSTVTVTGSGGTSPYTGTGTFTETAGTYSYIITDANGCTSTTTITITEPTLLTSSSSATSILCNGGNATVTVTGSGGTSPYTGDGTFTQTAGTYSYIVTDANGCTSTTTITITEPTVLTSGSSATSILCNGGNSTVTVTGSGGTSPYTGTGTFTETAGTYSYIVTDANGCTSTASITITEPTLLTSSSSATSILCNGGNATVTVIGSGGTSPYTGTGTFTETAGTYSYIVTDANGCTSTTSITITEPTLLTSSSSSTSILCNGGNATVTVIGAGGTAPYSGDGTFTETAGTYSYTITDANGCTSTTTITLTEPTAIATSVLSTNVSCFGGADGSIDLTVTGGTLPYSFDWNSGTYLTEDISGLFAGTYTGVLTDANGCTDSGTIIITEPAALVATLVSASNPTSCGGTEGAIDISITGGTPGYTFLWNTSVTTEDITGIGAGTYTCTVTDTNGCTTTVNASLNDPNAPVVTFALAIDTACQTTTGPFTLSGESPAGGTFSGPGVTGNGFDPMQANPGTNIIYYTYTDGNGCTASAVDSVFVDVCIGIVPSVTSNSFTIMPNPNNGTFVLEHNTTEAADVMICDALGQVVSLQKIQPGVQQQFDIAAPGIYMVILITSDGKRSTQRVIVNK